MKIVITGSLGNISKPLTTALVQKGHQVTVISSKTERQEAIETLGAHAAIGSIQDADFLSATFKGADIVYCMVTNDRNAFFDRNTDLTSLITQLGNNYKQAIENSGVKRVVVLSSIGAHTDKGNGILDFYYNFEGILKQAPDDVSIKFIRPTGFFTNIYNSIPTIKGQGVIISTYHNDRKQPWVSPFDIASAIVEEMESPFTGRSVRYVASDEVSPKELVRIIGQAIAKPDLKWLQIPSDQLLGNLLAAGMNPQIARGMVEMQSSQGSGLLYEDYNRNKPKLGSVKLTDFAKDFEKVFNSQ